MLMFYRLKNFLDIDVPERAQYIQVMFDEITRVLNHLLWLGAHALDIGAMSVFLYAFRKRGFNGLLRSCLGN